MSAGKVKAGIKILLRMSRQCNDKRKIRKYKVFLRYQNLNIKKRKVKKIGE